MNAVSVVLVVLAAVHVAFLLALTRLWSVRRERATFRGERQAPVTASLDDLAVSPHWWKRAEAARRSGAIARLGDAELRSRLLDDPHPAVQSVATSSLVPMTEPAVVGQLLDGLPERPMLVRLQQIRLLRDVLPLATPALLKRLTPDSSPRRLKSWITLAEALGTVDLLAGVAALHSHPDPLIRLSVARALKRHRHPDAEEVLLIALHDHDWRVRAVAARSLGTLGNPSAVPRLAAGLRDVRWWVRFRCGLALAQLGPAGREALDEAARDTDRYAGEMATMIAGLSPDSITELAEG